MAVQRHFDEDIRRLTELLLKMGAMVEDSISESIKALVDRDTDLANRVIERDQDIDALELRIDQEVLELIAKMQPMAFDLRFVATIMKITPDIERIGDLAQDICERAIELNREPRLKPVGEMEELARASQEMVRKALDAFVRRDADLAREVIEMDDYVDQLTERSFRELLTYMAESSGNVSRAIRLTFIGKYFERIGDSATNICEMVVYLVDGEVVKHSDLASAR